MHSFVLTWVLLGGWMVSAIRQMGSTTPLSMSGELADLVACEMILVPIARRVGGDILC
jgi:hypothetical protein